MRISCSHHGHHQCRGQQWRASVYVRDAGRRVVVVPVSHHVLCVCSDEDEEDLDEIDIIMRIFLRLKSALWTDLDDNVVAAEDGGDVAEPEQLAENHLPPFPQNEEEASALTVVQLKALLRSRDLPQYGTCCAVICSVS